MKAEQAPWQKLGFKLKLGLRAREEADWLPHDDLFDDHAARDSQLAYKAQLLGDRHNEVFAALPGSEPAGREVLAMVRAHLQQFHDASLPDLPADAGLHPLDAAARLVPEDLLLLEPRRRANGGAGGDFDWYLVAASLCFPAHWVLAEKMNKPLAAIHAPVPDYRERLETPMDRFFTNMKIGPISSRMNWSLQLGDELFSPHRSTRKAAMGDLANEDMCLRMENQTLRKLPETGLVLFTIRTHMVPMIRWQSTPGAIAALVDMLDQMSEAARNYKGAHLYRDALQQSLINS
jgi:hypothetical protein